MLWKYKQNKLYILVILLFYQGIFFFFGAATNNAYKIIIFIFAIWLGINKKAFSKQKAGDTMITVFFVAFSVFFLYTSFSNHDGWTIVFSQYSKYFIAYCLWFIVRKVLYSPKTDVDEFNDFVYHIILIQIVISVFKLIIFGGKSVEDLVGSISHHGGAAGTSLPILGFIALWFYRRGEFKLKDWLFVFGLLLIGYTSGKRAVWFVLPVVITVFMVYVPGLKVGKGLIVGILFAPLAFYFGARLTPSLNPEYKVWGSFDYEFVFDFADKYQNGDKTKKWEKRAQGRGGATTLLWDKWNSGKKLTDKDWFGIGLTSMYTTEYEDFNKLNTGISSKGSATGVFQTYLSNGYLGVFATLLFLLSILWPAKNRRIRWVLIAILAWEYFWYTGLIFRTPAFMFLVIYFVHYSNYLKKIQTKKKGVPWFAVPDSKPLKTKGYLDRYK
jgi:hypothetical protein